VASCLIGGYLQRGVGLRRIVGARVGSDPGTSICAATPSRAHATACHTVQRLRLRDFLQDEIIECPSPNATSRSASTIDGPAEPSRWVGREGDLLPLREGG